MEPDVRLHALGGSSAPERDIMVADLCFLCQGHGHFLGLFALLLRFSQDDERLAVGRDLAHRPGKVWHLILHVDRPPCGRRM